MSDIIQVDDLNFEEVVLQSKIPVLVYFGAVWCAPCQRQVPIIEKFASDNNHVKVCKVDIDDAPALTSKLGIRGVPNLVIFNEGKSVASQVGLSSLTDLNYLISTING